jgi:hypothetical protein
MTDDRHLAALCALSAISYRAAQAEMAELMTREEGLRRNLDQLVLQRQARFEGGLDPSDTALRGGADMRWQRWVDQRRAVINAELALVLAQRSECRRRLQHAFGKDQAIQMLHAEAKSRVKQLRQRRDLYES